VVVVVVEVLKTVWVLKLENLNSMEVMEKLMKLAALMVVGGMKVLMMSDELVIEKLALVEELQHAGEVFHGDLSQQCKTPLLNMLIHKLHIQQQQSL
jgi:hypothetical protein